MSTRNGPPLPIPEAPPAPPCPQMSHATARDPGELPAPYASSLFYGLSLDTLYWFRCACHRSSIFYQLRCQAKRHRWTEQALLLALTEALYRENEALKERLAQYIGKHGLPGDAFYETKISEP